MESGFKIVAFHPDTGTASQVKKNIIILKVIPEEKEGEGPCEPYCLSSFIQTWEQTVPLPDKNSEQNSPKLYLINQFGNNMFHSQIRTGNKAVLSHQSITDRNSEQNSPKFVSE